jgi:Protein of unknown function (DUF1615)
VTARFAAAARTAPAARFALVALLAVAAGCTHELRPSEPQISPEDAHALIDRALPPNIGDRAGWNNDIYTSFASLTVAPTHENVCAVVAVIAQESSFRVDPVVPNLGVIAKKEIDTRAARAHVPLMIVHGVLDLKSANGRTYNERIDAARTEKDLSDIFEDFIAGVPMGRTLFDDKNPIRTRGPMQVNVAFAEQFSAATPYPYPVARSVADEVFTRRGSLYFGIAHLLDYRAPYDDYIYRFADFNAGQYSSRNAAFQNALSVLTGAKLLADGALLPHEGSAGEPGATELAARSLAKQLNLSDAAIHAALAEGRTKGFEATSLYQRVFSLADGKRGRMVPRAALPQIKLGGPKIKRDLSTAWYAHRVDDRFKRCLSSAR